MGEYINIIITVLVTGTISMLLTFFITTIAQKKTIEDVAKRVINVHMLKSHQYDEEFRQEFKQIQKQLSFILNQFGINPHDIA